MDFNFNRLVCYRSAYGTINLSNVIVLKIKSGEIHSLFDFMVEIQYNMRGNEGRL